jgi:transcriptional regulator with XRE-family HTH domain
MNIDETIGANVHQQMWRARVSQTRLAGALGIDQAAVSRRLRGQTPWKASEVMAAAALLGVEIVDLYPPSPVTEPAAAAVSTRENTRQYGHSARSYPIRAADGIRSMSKTICPHLPALQVAGGAPLPAAA